MIFLRIVFIFLAISTFALAGCWPNRVINPTELKEFDKWSRTQSQQQYIIGPHDVLDIKFFYNPELNEINVPVRPDGRISLSLVPEIQVAGLTVDQLQRMLSEKYSSELKKPEVVVIVRSFNAFKAYFDGEVVYPGPVELRGPTTLMQALSQARGLRESARLSDIIVIRKDGNGQAMSTTIDLRKIIDGTDHSQNIYLMPYDIVYVPKSVIANVNKFVNEYINGPIPARFPEFTNFYNPYTFSFGGKTDFQQQ